MLAVAEQQKTAPSNTRSTEVSIRKIDVAFGSMVVLKELELDVRPSEFLVLLGSSGCGKSTLLNAIAGLQEVSRGQIWIGGKNVTWAEPKDRGVAMVFQSYALYPRMTVRENMSFGLKVAGVPKAEVEKRVMTAANILQIGTLLHRRPAELSGGQRQRVAMGRAIVRDVGLFLFDEPLSNLDAQLRAELRVEIKRLHQRLNATMIYVTHDQIEALTLADRIALMKDGIIQQLGTPDDVFFKPVNKYVASFIGSPRMNFFTAEIDQDRSVARIGDLSIPLAGYEFSTKAGRKGEIDLGIRPQHVRIVDENAGTAVTVELVEPMGSESVVWTRLGDMPMSIVLQGDKRARVGDVIRIDLPASSVHMFDSTDGTRL